MNNALDNLFYQEKLGIGKKLHLLKMSETDPEIKFRIFKNILKTRK